MEPAKSIVQNLGGARKVAAIAGVHPSRVWAWMREAERDGTGGIIPFKHVPKLIAAARAAGINLSGDDFLPNGRAAE